MDLNKYVALNGTNLQEIELLFSMAKGASYVANNPDYKDKADNTKIAYDPSGTVNAYASSHQHRNEHYIQMFGGLCHAGLLCSLALVDRNPAELIKVCNFIGERAVIEGEFHLSDVSDGITALNLDTSERNLREAKGFAAGFTLGVVAHELGHICLSHTRRGEVDDSISRDDERHADLFACSVAGTTIFSQYIVVGLLFGEIVLTWVTKDYSNGPATTHPHSRERVMNMLTSHEETLADYGITRDNIEQFLP
jgi:hypothetical protein